MNDSSKTKNEQVLVSEAKNDSKVVYVEAFQTRKKDSDYKKALDRVLLRAQKNEW
ncbi:hypothetical protein GNQ68_15635 [Pseudomonas aeruginosa]|nr:hypothetical protein [Pseudomonas aeruginosa]